MRGQKPPVIHEGETKMSAIVKYLMIGTALVALSLGAACKGDSAAKEQITSGAESAGKAGVEAGVSAGQDGGMKEGAKEGGKAAATDVVN
ncbi:MAG: hypothetical protein AAGF92_02850 [Myxococcota bacterium]